MKNNLELATLAGGCFWCTEAIFKRLKGVESVLSGYAGGQVQNPSYYQVSSGTSGHAESIQISFDPKVITYSKILDIFWHTHNPTTKDSQGYDAGHQYRSVIFYHSETQRIIAEKSKTAFEKQGEYKDKVVTEVIPYTNFYPAEGDHQDYYGKNKYNPYCVFIINPKIRKLLKNYSKDIKEEYLK